MKRLILLLVCAVAVCSGCQNTHQQPTPLPAMEPVDPSLIPTPPVRYSE